MPEANVLYVVTTAVVLGLIGWVLVVLRTAKEPWARDAASQGPSDVDAPPPAVLERAIPSPGANDAVPSETSGASATGDSTDTRQA